MPWGMPDEVYREAGDGPRVRRAHWVRVYLSLLCWAENHYWWSAIFKGFPSGGDWMGRDEPLKKTRQGERGWHWGIEGKGGKRTRGWRKTAAILWAGAVGPMGASVDAPGSLLKYNSDGFYVGFRTHLMSLPSYPDAMFTFTLGNWYSEPCAHDKSLLLESHRSLPSYTL